MKRLRFLIVIFTMFCLTQVNAQNNANKLLQAVYNTLQKANDYTVKANIRVDIPAIHIHPVDVTIFFKQKDNFKVDTKGIAIVPQQGFNQASKLLADTNSYTAMIQRTEKFESISVILVNVIPSSETNEIVLGKLWIDPKRNVIMKAQYTTRSNGTIEADYSYGSQVTYGLPDKITFNVDVKKFKIIKSVSEGAVSNPTPEKDNNDNQNKKGKIFIVLSNYQVNKGIPDSKFQK